MFGLFQVFDKKKHSILGQPNLHRPTNGRPEAQMHPQLPDVVSNPNSHRKCNFRNLQRFLKIVQKNFQKILALFLCVFRIARLPPTAARSACKCSTPKRGWARPNAGN